MLSTPLTQTAESTAVISELCARGDVFLSSLCLTGSEKKKANSVECWTNIPDN